MTTSAAGLIQAFARRRVVVLGDMVADEYIVGRPEKISREAPVVVLRLFDTFVRLGGATNTASNLRSLGAGVEVIGVVGDDEPGRRLQAALESASIETRGLLVDPHRPTSTKTRVIGKGAQEVQQQIVRIDRVDERPVDGALRDRMIDRMRSCLEEVDAVLIADYENGVISQDVIDACLPRAREMGCTVTVDSHGSLWRFRGVTAATPNQPEAESTVGRPILSPQDLHDVGAELLRGMEAEHVLITRGAEGMSLFTRADEPFTLPVAVQTDRDVVDPAGAGDTVSAVFTLALACGAPPRMAAFMSNVAGGEAVRRLGTVALSPAELLAAIHRSGYKPSDAF